MNAPLRHFVSPYARRLARERDIPLDVLKGSGPSGRIVAVDILSFTPTAVAEEPPVPTPSPAAEIPVAAAPVVTVSAIAAQVDFGKIQELLAQFAGAQLPISIDALIIRAAARALAQFDAKTGIDWESGIGADRCVTEIGDAAGLSMAALRSRMDAVGSAADIRHPTFLSIRRFRQSGIRAVSMQLLPGHAMRLIVSMASTDAGECLLCFDAGRVGEDDAVAFLAQLRDDLETPLRLLA